MLDWLAVLIQAGVLISERRCVEVIRGGGCCYQSEAERFGFLSESRLRLCPSFCISAARHLLKPSCMSILWLIADLFFLSSAWLPSENKPPD